MKQISYLLLVSLLSVAAVCAQSQSRPASSAAGSNESSSRRGPVFRATKDQIIAAQTKLKSKGVYSGEASGSLDDATRASIKSYQKDNGLRATGTLNRATLEKLGIALNEKQKAIPISENSYASAGSNDDKPRRPVFRATKDQVIEAQRVLKSGGMYAGEETGKLDDTMREGLKRYQEANGLKSTGTLNQVTLEKMGIALTDKQRSAAGTK